MNERRESLLKIAGIGFVVFLCIVAPFALAVLSYIVPPHEWGIGLPDPNSITLPESSADGPFITIIAILAGILAVCVVVVLLIMARNYFRVFFYYPHSGRSACALHRPPLLPAWQEKIGIPGSHVVDYLNRMIECIICHKRSKWKI